MKIKLFAAREIQYFELGIFSFFYVYYLTCGFSASTRVFNPPTRAFNLPIRAFNLATCAFSLLTRAFELVTRESELATREFELVTCGFELVTRNSRFTFPLFCKVVVLRNFEKFTGKHLCQSFIYSQVLVKI